MFWLGCAVGVAGVVVMLLLYEYRLRPGRLPLFMHRRADTVTEEAWKQTRRFLYYDGSPPMSDENRHHY